MQLNSDHSNVVGNTNPDVSDMSGANIEQALMACAFAFANNPLIQYNPYKFSAYQNASSTLNAGWNQLAFQLKEFDTSTSFNTTTGQFVAPVDGYYCFQANCEITVNPGEEYIIAIYKNGSEFKRGPRLKLGGAGVSNIGLNISTPPMFLSSGNTVTAHAYNGSAGAKGTVAGQPYTYFGGHLLSRG